MSKIAAFLTFLLLSTSSIAAGDIARVPTAGGIAAVPTAPSSPIIGGGGGSGGGGGGGGGGGAGGLSSNIAVSFTCNSFGQQVTSTEALPATLNIKFGAGVTCWATATTVSGTPVNDTGTVPNTWFDWDWQDTSLGSVTRGGVSMNLGRSYGVVAAHVFLPSSFSSSCNGNTNFLANVKLTVTTIISLARDNDFATMAICVENPSITWPAPIAYCDDNDCSNDTGVPAGSVHGGNLTDLATIISSCNSGSKWIALKGGVTFTTGSTGIAIGAFPCLIQSYGPGGQAKLKFSSTSSSSSAINSNNANCAGVVFNNVLLAGSGTGPRLITGQTNTGCFTIANSATANGTEKFSSAMIADPAGATVMQSAYFAKLTWNQTPGGGLAPFFFYCDWCAFIGGEISGVNGHVSAEQNLRSAQERYLVIDSMLFKDGQYCRQTNSSANCSQEGGQASKSLIELRQDCGTSVANASCPNSSNQGPFAVTRTEIQSYSNGIDGVGTGLPGGGNFSTSYPIQIGTSGTGGNEPTKTYDGDLIGNIITFTADFTANNQCIQFTGGGIAGTETKRIRLWFNVCDGSSIDSSTADRLINVAAGGASNFLAVGNVIVATKNHSRTYNISGGGSALWDVVLNNVGFENGAASSLDLFPGFTEDTGNNKAISSGTSPFTVTPGQFTAFGLDDLIPLNGGALQNVSNALDAATSDADGDARCQGAACDPGAQEIP